MTAKLKVGDTVTIREWDDMEGEYGLNDFNDIEIPFGFNRQMSYLCGKRFEIKHIQWDHAREKSKYILGIEGEHEDGLRITNGMWVFSREMFKNKSQKPVLDLRMLRSNKEYDEELL